MFLTRRGMMRGSFALFWLLVFVAWLLQGCATAPSQRYLIASVAADSATTVYGLTQTDAREVGPVASAFGGDFALVTAIAVDVGVLLVRRWLGRRFPSWRGWHALDYAFGSMKAGAALHNFSVLEDVR